MEAGCGWRPGGRKMRRKGKEMGGAGDGHRLWLLGPGTCSFGVLEAHRGVKKKTEAQ